MRPVGRRDILVLGIGNLVMSDDGIGVRVLQHLERGFSFADEVELLEGGTLGLDLLPRLEGVARLLVVDAIDAGEAPGTLVRLTGDQVPLALETRLSPHQMGLKDLLAVASLQGIEPAEMVLLGVQPERIELGLELSPPVAAALDSLMQGVLFELERWGVATQIRTGTDEDLSFHGRYWCL